MTVNAAPAGQFTTGAPVSSTYKAELVETLPLNRTITGAAMLAPGVQSAGPSGNVMINGAMSFESLFVVNGVVVNENLRGQPQPLFIEDALQETTVKTGSVSAEYGRFQGGVVEAITKSGGNTFRGSYRATADNDSWTALTPYPNDSRADNPYFTHEATLGGPLWRDRLWFFGAGRLAKRETIGTTAVTALGYPIVRDQRRYEGKLTGLVRAGHTLRGAYTRIQDLEQGNATLPIMDVASLVTRRTPQDLKALGLSAREWPKHLGVGLLFGLVMFVALNVALGSVMSSLLPRTATSGPSILSFFREPRNLAGLAANRHLRGRRGRGASADLHFYPVRKMAGASRSRSRNRPELGDVWPGAPIPRARDCDLDCGVGSAPRACLSAPAVRPRAHHRARFQRRPRHAGRNDAGKVGGIYFLSSIKISQRLMLSDLRMPCLSHGSFFILSRTSFLSTA